MHCFIYAALTSAINTASVLLTIPFVLCSALYFAKCTQAWAFHNLQVGKSLHLHGEKKTIKTLLAASFLCSLAHPGLNALISLHSPPYSVDQKRDKRWHLPGRALCWEACCIFPLKGVWVGPTDNFSSPQSSMLHPETLKPSSKDSAAAYGLWGPGDRSCKYVPVQNPRHVPVQNPRLGK